MIPNKLPGQMIVELVIHRNQGPKFRTIQLSKAWYTQNRTWRLWRRGVVCMVIFFISGYMVEVWFWKVSTEASHGYGKKTKFIPSKQKTQKKYRDIHQLKLACCIVLDRVGNYTNGKVRLKNVTLILPPLGEIGRLITSKRRLKKYLLKISSRQYIE